MEGLERGEVGGAERVVENAAMKPLQRVLRVEMIVELERLREVDSVLRGGTRRER